MTIAGTIGLDEFGFATFVPDAESKRDALITLFYNLADEEEDLYWDEEQFDLIEKIGYQNWLIRQM